MSEEEIKSPLPPRKVILETVEEENNKTEPKEENLNRTDVQPPLPPVETPSQEPKKISRKLILIIGGIVAFILVALIGFWLVKKNSKQEVVTLNYWGLWEEESAMGSVIADFEAKNPNIKINYIKNQIDGYAGRLSGRLAKSGESDDVPDIFRIHNTWIPMFRNYLAPVPDETISNLALSTDFYNVYKKDLMENGKYLSIPLMYDGLVMYYNTDLLSKAQMTVPTSWWDLKKASVKMTEKDSNGKIQVAGAGVGMIENVDHWSDIVGLMMAQNGVDFTNIGTTENQSKLKDVLNFYTLFATSDKVWDETLPNSTQLFANGKLGFYFGPSWRIFDIKTLNPNLKFGVAVVPQLPTIGSSTESIGSTASLTNIHWATYWTEGINSKSKNTKEAWTFLEYLASKQAMEKLYQADSQIREFGQIYPRKSMSSKISENSQLKPFVDTADSATSWYLASNTGDDGLNTEMQKYFGDAINKILTNSQYTDEALETLISGINQVKQKYKLTK